MTTRDDSPGEGSSEELPDDVTVVASRHAEVPDDEETRLSSRLGGAEGSEGEAGGGAAGSSVRDRREPGSRHEPTEERTRLSRVRGVDRGATQASPDARPHADAQRQPRPPDHVPTDTWSGTFGAPDAPYPPRPGTATAPEPTADAPKPEGLPPSAARPPIHVLSPEEVTRRRDAARRKRVVTAAVVISVTCLVVLASLAGAALLLSGL